MNRAKAFVGIAAVVLGINSMATARIQKTQQEVNGITYHISSHTQKRPDNIEPYKNYGVDVTTSVITDGYLKIYTARYQDQPNTVYILGAKEPNDRQLRPLAFPPAISNLEKMFASQGKKVIVNRKRTYR